MRPEQCILANGRKYVISTLLIMRCVFRLHFLWDVALHARALAGRCG